MPEIVLGTLPRRDMGVLRQDACLLCFTCPDWGYCLERGNGSLGLGENRLPPIEHLSNKAVDAYWSTTTMSRCLPMFLNDIRAEMSDHGHQWVDAGGVED